jgi:hypothetical protein
MRCTNLCHFLFKTLLQWITTLCCIILKGIHIRIWVFVTWIIIFIWLSSLWFSVVLNSCMVLAFPGCGGHLNIMFLDFFWVCRAGSGHELLVGININGHCICL